MQRCKSERSSCAKVCLTRCVRGTGAGTGVGVGKYFQVSGLGNRVPGSGVQVLVQVQDLNFAPHPHLYLITRTRDLRAETSDPKMSLMFVSLQLGQHAVLTLPVTTAGAWSRLPKAERLTPERPMPRWLSPVTRYVPPTFASLHRPQAGLHFCT